MLIVTESDARNVFFYDAADGCLIWRRRPVDHFKDESYQRRWNNRYAHKRVGNVGDTGYLRINLCGRMYLAHRVVWLYVHGEWPNGEIDHINGDRSDNRISNLRLVTKTQNARNARRPVTNTSGIVGVSYDTRDKKWHAYIGVGNGQRTSLGYFATKEEAVAARRGAQRVLGYHSNHGRAA